MAGLFTEDSVTIITETGESKIELCFGDITKLKKEEKVDVVLVSAFRGDYSPTPLSLIGALNKYLKINVEDLSQDKEEDLRKLYSCWWSKPLPEDCCFKRLLCFEIRRMVRGHPAELVGDVFRCLVSVLNNQDGSVITPLLATGDQGYPKALMLRGMVEGAVNWIKAGLPLRKLKIVLFANISQSSQVDQVKKKFEAVCQMFSALKEKYETQQYLPKEVPVEYDVYLSHSESDSSSADEIKQGLKKQKSNIKIFEERQDLNTDEVWQENIYQAMMKCAKIVTVLSPAYLSSTRCMEQYNIALCCNRKTKRDMLAPFYVESVPVLPTYMGLVQYVDCRPHAIQKIQVACVQLIDSLSKLISLSPQNRSHVSQRLKFEYDVFLSYSHKNSNKASLLLNGLLEVDSSLKIFFDTEELKTGTAWQETLYHAIDGSHCMIACISKDYLQSPVCQEEYNLALAKHYSKDNEHQLIPVCIDDITEPPLEFTKVPMLDYRNMKTQEDVQDLCHQVVAMLQHPDTMKTELLKKQSVIDMSLTDIDLLADDYQQLDFSRKYGSTSKASLRQTALSCKMLTTTENEDDGDKQKCDIAISFAVADMKYARYLTTLLKQNAPQLIVNDTMSSDHTQISVLETANKVVCLLTANYIESPSQCEEFHIALFRHRANPASPVLFPIQISALPKKPTYFHLVPYELNCTSPLWKKIIVEMGLTETLEEFRKNVGRTLAERVTKEEAMALYKGTEAILLTMKAESEKSASSHLTQSIILHNIHYMRFMIMKMKNSEYTEDVQQYLYKLSVTEGEPNAATKQKQPGVKTKTKNISPKKDKTTSSGKVTSKVKDNQEDVTIETVSRQSHVCCII